MPPRGEDLVERPLADQGAVASEHAPPGDPNAHRRRSARDACAFEDIEQFAMRDYARPATGQLRSDALVSANIPTSAPQEKSGEEPSHRSADDQRLAPGSEPHRAIIRQSQSSVFSSRLLRFAAARGVECPELFIA